MPEVRRFIAVIAAFLLLAATASSDETKVLRYQHSDEYEVVLAPDGKTIDTMFASGNVIFQTDSGTIYCDSAIWAVGRDLVLRGKVVIDDASYHLVADSVRYDEKTRVAVARGSYVEVLTRQDSIFAVGRHVQYERAPRKFRMEERPTVYLKYPDSAKMIEVTADRVDFDSENGLAEAEGDVKIDSRDLSASSGCAVLQLRKNVLDLFDNPAAQRGRSVIRGGLITVYSANDVLSRIDVLDSARGDFIEPIGKDTTHFDNSKLTGKKIIMNFEQGNLIGVTSVGQAYSWYYPSSQGKPEEQQNSVSGDTIRFAIKDERLQSVTVIGGGIGRYLDSKMVATSDSTKSRQVDTVDYTGARIVYDLTDSTITLNNHATVNSGTMALSAEEIEFQTRHRLVKAYSANITKPSEHVDSTLLARFQPNPIPVILKDKEEELYGDFLEYSMETQKGRIVQSKSSYETGLYYGRKVARATKDIYYVDDGRYTTCNAEEPHFHFHSPHMKLINNDKLLAKPVVLYIGRLPILALPYYVFPMKKGRHSGILPFRVGNLSQGDKYIENVGYYWAASDYWDWQNALSYREFNTSLTWTTAVNYVILYKLSGSVTANISRETSFDRYLGTERKRTRWTIAGSHRQEFSGGWKIDASGSYQSDASYYQDYSADLADRTNRNLRSVVNFSKRFSKTVALSGSFSHEQNLDAQTKTDRLPTMGISLPVIKPFGSGRIDDQGKLVPRWYNNLTVAYRPSMTNFAYSAVKDSVIVDTIGTDTLGAPVIVYDTLSRGTRKKYTRLDHAVSMNFPMTVAKYFVFNPNFNYTENWFKIHRTDQSDAAGINASRLYRTYIYTTGVSLSTTVYGTVRPNVFGLKGLRQVLMPSVSYGYTPKINRFPIQRGFAGGGAGSTAKVSSLSASLGQIYQAKIKQGESERNLDLFSLQSGLSYDFEDTVRHFSDLTTIFQSQVLPRISISGSMVHSLYKPGTNTLNLRSPYLASFSILSSITIAGNQFLFDEPVRIERGADSATQVAAAGQSQVRPGGQQGWSIRVDYAYSESGRDQYFQKQSSLNLAVFFNLTPNTTVTFRQAYDPVSGQTINSQVGIVRQLHCWTGEFSWVPVGSNRGYSFRLYVTAIPALKIDNSNTLVNGSLLQNAMP
ncbi:hypothetical protein C3F09_01455 [candidate division GN15 bacterium]|uniref:LPS-assembly protein LptD central domain-containing protein n=1 Tax=candidate division GN15 bacterium TaxID=2072418 RepID=A0A855X784_9BACT|nr:MAG: hypothetical protein C3F09_01455 [candidate division GN15 bacterium]